MFKSGIVSLTYDGGLPCHFETAQAHLNEFGLMGSFYVDPVSLLENLPEWGGVVAAGHEVGNGSILTAANDTGELFMWTEQMVEDDVRAARELIEDLFPEQGAHSIAMPLQSQMGGDEPFVDVVTKQYEVVKSGFDARLGVGPKQGLVSAHFCNGTVASEVLSYVANGLERFGWAVISFKGVGVGAFSVDACVHREVCRAVSLGGVKVLPVVAASQVAATSSVGGPRLA